MNRFTLPLLALLACKGQNPTGYIDPDPVTNPNGDADGDGLTNAEEAEGWTIFVNQTGYPDETMSVEVSSDPAIADTDGDGLDDLEERTANTDPTRRDTDGDDLDDREELLRWQTDPTHVDTDGDAVDTESGFDPAPQRQLFDGNELNLVGVEGVWMAGPGATSPLRADTDADGRNDLEEYDSPLFSPVVAERSALEVFLTPGSVVDLALDVTYSGAVTEQVQHTAALENADGSEIGAGTLMSATAGVSLTDRARIGGWVAAGCCETLVGGGVFSETEQRARAYWETTVGYDFSYDSWSSAVREHEVFEERSASTATTIDGATVSALFDLVNPGLRTYTVENLSVALYYRQDGELRPFANLSGLTGPITLGPGEQVTGILLRDDGAIATLVEELMASPRRVVVSPATFDLVDVTDTPVAFQAERIQEETARVVLQNGSEAERFDVAVTVGRDVDGNPIGLTTREVFDTLGILSEDTVEANPALGTDELAVYIDGLGPEYHDEPGSSFSGLDLAGYPTSGGPGDRLLAETWGALIHRAEADLPVVPSMLDVRLEAGDIMEIVRVRDRDQDGLVDLEEMAAGTFDGVVDSDAVDGESDGLSDFFELREPWTVAVEGEIPYEVYGVPSHMDFDNDGLNDGQELAAGTDPLSTDTDGDQYTDGSEIAAGFDPLVRDLDAEALRLECRVIPTDPSQVAWQYEVVATPAVGASVDLAAIGIDYGRDASEVGVAPGSQTASAVFPFPNILGTPSAAFVRDSVGLEQRVICPDPVPGFARACLNCPQTVPEITCLVDDVSGSINVEVTDAGGDLLEVQTETSLTIEIEAQATELFRPDGNQCYWDQYPVTTAPTVTASETWPLPFQSSWAFAGGGLPASVSVPQIMEIPDGFNTWECPVDAGTVEFRLTDGLAAATATPLWWFHQHNGVVFGTECDQIEPSPGYSDLTGPCFTGWQGGIPPFLPPPDPTILAASASVAVSAFDLEGNEVVEVCTLVSYSD